MEPAGGTGEPRPAAGWRDDELILISALEYWSYCPRQCALIQMEQTWGENVFTMRGKRVHERAHAESTTEERGVRVVRGLPIWSDRLGLVGKADVVECHGAVPYPIEYKSGRWHGGGHEAAQLCAQAMCLEEMLGVEAPEGAIFAHAARQRRPVRFDAALRERVERMVAEIRAMLASERLPPALDNDPRCRQCVLLDACLPAISASPARMRGHWAELFHPQD